MNIDKLSVAVEIKGKPYFVIIPKGSKELCLRMIAGLSDDSQLNVVSAPEGFSFTSLEEQG
jgi:hypothetical protein